MKIKSFNFTKRYVLALSFIALLSTLAYFNLKHLIVSQSQNGELINIAGKQRMLSQQISLNAIYYKIKRLKDNVKLMEQNHNKLLNSPLTKELRDIYFKEPAKLDYEVKSYIKEAKKFLENRNGKSLTYLLNNSKILLKDLDTATSAYVKMANENTKKLQLVELLIFISTILTLIIEALFIFRPANRQIIEDREIITKEKDYSNMVIESSNSAIITLDSNLKIKTYNKMAEHIFGYSKEEMIDKKMFDKIVPLFSGLNSKAFLETIHLLNSKEVLELEGVNNKNEHFPIRVSFGVKVAQDNMIVANIQNISKEKLKDKLLEQQAKFAALGEMIAIIAHQWRQPLSQLSFNNIYLKRKIKDQELKEELEDNENIIQFMSETITNFQNFYKKDTTNRNFNLSNAVEQVLKMLESILKLKEIKVEKNFDSKVTIYGNANSLSQVILSIIQNSLDVISARKIENPKIKIIIKRVENFNIIEIEDNAKGIEEKPISNIFKPFLSKKQTPSTGVGLYMCKMIIEDKFKGKIEAFNTKLGAKFIISVPYS